MSVARTSVAICTLPLLAALSAACGGSHVEATAPSGTSTVRYHREVASNGRCLGRRRVVEALGTKLPDLPPSVSSDDYPVTAGPALSPSNAYRVAAPSTVLIRTRDGLGSGVVVDASGLILTNFHVVDDFQQPDLTMKVSLEFPEVQATGRMGRSNKVYEGLVVKSDPVKDLALVKITNPPPNLPVIRLSDVDPQIGEDALSIGHAGIGLLWAAKTCTVSSVGDQTRDVGMLEAGDCDLKDPSDTPDEANRRHEQCEARKRQVKEMVEGATQGVSIQTSCNITHGDSGGPLLNGQGQLIGLNQSLRFDATTVAFHVHVAEIRAFLKGAGTTPVQAVPDPWCEGGSEATAEDLDGDGKKETVKLEAGFGGMFGGGEDGATFLDLNEDAGKSTPTEDRPFAADVILLARHGELLAWYDTDDDGHLDVLLRDKEADGTVEIGWRVDANGHYTQDKALEKVKTIDVSLVKNAALHQRFGVVADSLDWARIASDETIALAASVSVPDPFSGGVESAQAFGSDGPHEKPTEVFAVGPGGQATFIDTRSDALGHLKMGDDARSLIENKSLKPQFVSLQRPNGRWAFYDSTDDGKLDVALFAKTPFDADEGYGSGSYVTDAFDLSSSPPKRMVQNVGRSVIRPKLMPNEKVRKVVAARDPGDDGRSSFPKPFQVGGRGAWQFDALGTSKRRVLERIDRATSVAIVDLAGKSKGAATRAADDFIRDQSWVGDIVFYRMGRIAWVFYDTDKDGVYDEVLFTKDLKTANVDAAFRLNKAGDVVTPLTDVVGTVFQPERVTKNAKLQAELGVVWQRVVHREKAEGGSKPNLAPPSSSPPPHMPSAPPPRK